MRTIWLLLGVSHGLGDECIAPRNDTLLALMLGITDSGQSRMSTEWPAINCGGA